MSDDDKTIEREITETIYMTKWIGKKYRFTHLGSGMALCSCEVELMLNNYGQTGTGIKLNALVRADDTDKVKEVKEVWFEPNQRPADCARFHILEVAPDAEVKYAFLVTAEAVDFQPTFLRIRVFAVCSLK